MREIERVVFALGCNWRGKEERRGEVERVVSPLTVTEQVFIVLPGKEHRRTHQFYYYMHSISPWSLLGSRTPPPPPAPQPLSSL